MRMVLSYNAVIMVTHVSPFFNLPKYTSISTTKPYGEATSVPGVGDDMCYILWGKRRCNKKKHKHLSGLEENAASDCSSSCQGFTISLILFSSVFLRNTKITH